MQGPTFSLEHFIIVPGALSDGGDADIDISHLQHVHGRMQKGFAVAQSFAIDEAMAITVQGLWRFQSLLSSYDGSWGIRVLPQSTPWWSSLMSIYQNIPKPVFDHNRC